MNAVRNEASKKLVPGKQFLDYILVTVKVLRHRVTQVGREASAGLDGCIDIFRPRIAVTNGYVNSPCPHLLDETGTSGPFRSQGKQPNLPVRALLQAFEFVEFRGLDKFPGVRSDVTLLGTEIRALQVVAHHCLGRQPVAGTNSFDGDKLSAQRIDGIRRQGK